jgi:plasmid stability protein
MTPLVIENLEDELRIKLVDLARDHGRSVEEEVRGILRDALVVHPAMGPNLGSRIAACFAGRGLEQEIPEFRGQLVEPLTFDP